MGGWVGTERMVRQPLFVQENTIFTERTVVTSGVITQFAASGVRTDGPQTVKRSTTRVSAASATQWFNDGIVTE